jgi:hypothetical protein
VPGKGRPETGFDEKHGHVVAGPLDLEFHVTDLPEFRRGEFALIRETARVLSVPLGLVQELEQLVGRFVAT